MDRLTRPTVNVDETAAQYMGKEIDLETVGDRLLELILNGPTLNAVKKDTLRHIIRQLYGALQAYEATGMEPEEIVRMQAMAEGIFQKYGRLYELAQEEDAKGGAHELRLSE